MNVEKLIQVKMPLVREQVVNILREAILMRELNAGDPLNINDLSMKLGVSATPIREALQVLESDGLVCIKPRRGAVVADIDEKYIRDYYQTRIILECAAVQMACAEGKDLTALLKNFQKMELAVQNSEHVDYGSLNYSFHATIWSICGNERIKRLLESFWISRSISAHHDSEQNAKTSFQEHKEIMEAVVARNAERAGVAMQKHLERSMDDVLSHFI